MIKIVEDNGTMIALIIKASYKSDGIKFFTDRNAPFQVGYMRRSPGHTIEAHSHKENLRYISQTQEVLFIKSGAVIVDFYNLKEQYIESAVLESSDVLFLASGGHGFEMIDECEIIEVKQGPYEPLDDKTFFPAIKEDERVYPS